MPKFNLSSSTYAEEFKICRNAPDDIILKRITLYKRIENDTVSKLTAARHALEQRYPHLIKDEGESIEEVIERNELKAPKDVKKVGSIGTKTISKDKQEKDKPEPKRKVSSGLSNELTYKWEDSKS